MGERGEERRTKRQTDRQTNPHRLEDHRSLSHAWLESIYASHRDELSRFASHVLGYTGLVDPDDLVQQSAADVLARDIQLPPDERKAVAFIRCMIRYRARNVQRHIRAVASHETHLEELYREPVLADDVCEANEVAMVVRKTIESLPERTRLIVQLYRLRDLPAREVAGVLGVTESTVRELDRRGRRQLRSHLQRWREQNRGAE
jgi:RNA polymerase sigma factor (sigma-70 family)